MSASTYDAKPLPDNPPPGPLRVRPPTSWSRPRPKDCRIRSLPGTLTPPRTPSCRGSPVPGKTHTGRAPPPKTRSADTPSVCRRPPNNSPSGPPASVTEELKPLHRKVLQHPKQSQQVALPRAVRTDKDVQAAQLQVIKRANRLEAPRPTTSQFAPWVTYDSAGVLCERNCLAFLRPGSASTYFSPCSVSRLLPPVAVASRPGTSSAVQRRRGIAELHLPRFAIE